MRLLVAAALALLAGPASAADLTIGGFGGVWERAAQACFVKAFETATGKTVAIQLGSSEQWLNQIAANPSHPPLDVVLNSIDIANAAVSRGLVDRMDAAHVPVLPDVGRQFVEIGHGYGAVYDYGAMGLAYNSDTVKEPPRSWQDFVEGTIAGKWKASIPGINYASTPMAVIWLFAKLYGGTVDDVTPGLAKIKADARQRQPGVLERRQPVPQPAQIGRCRYRHVLGWPRLVVPR